MQQSEESEEDGGTEECWRTCALGSLQEEKWQAGLLLCQCKKSGRRRRRVEIEAALK